MYDIKPKYSVPDSRRVAKLALTYLASIKELICVNKYVTNLGFILKSTSVNESHGVLKNKRLLVTQICIFMECVTKWSQNLYFHGLCDEEVSF